MGNKIKVVITLKNTWNHAICIAGWLVINCKNEMTYFLKIQINIVKIKVPKQLKSKWIIPVLLALILVPIVLIKAVTQVPILEPKIINRPLPISIDPPWTMTIINPAIADEDCINAVKTIPNRRRAKGKSNFSNPVLKTDLIESSLHESLIISNPMNIIPNPHIIPPKFFKRSFLKNIKTTPIKAKKLKYIDKFKLCKEAKIPVIVVPILAPIIIAVAWCKFIVSALTKPIAITVVAAELWIIIVTIAPIPTPAKRLSVIFPKSLRIPTPATFCKLELIIFIAAMKTPVPANKDIMHSYIFII